MILYGCTAPYYSYPQKAQLVVECWPKELTNYFDDPSGICHHCADEDKNKEKAGAPYVCASAFVYVHDKLENKKEFYRKRKDHDNQEEVLTSQEEPERMDAFNYLIDEVCHFFIAFTYSCRYYRRQIQLLLFFISKMY